MLKARSNDIVQLTDLDHVRTRPGMYVGDTSLSPHGRWTLRDGKLRFETIEFVPAVLKLFDEIVSNSIDEAYRTGYKAGKGSDHFTIWVDTDSDGRIKIRDNGRGIPLTPFAANPKMTQAEAALTLLRAGANFDKAKHVSIGTHGLGATLVNVLSDDFRAEVFNSGKRLRLKASRGVTESVKLTDEDRDPGTTIEFAPDWSMFGVDGWDENHLAMIAKRVADLATCLPRITFKLNGRVVQTRSFDKYVAQAADAFLSDEGDRYKVAVFSSEDPQQISFVNGIDTYEGGSHVDFVRNRVVDVITERLNKKFKFDIKPADVRNRLCFVVVASEVEDPKFRSQTKEFLTSAPRDFAETVFQGFNPEKFGRKIADNPDLVDPIVETFRLKQEAKERAELKKAKRQVARVKVASHIPANSKDRSKTILFITEGQSAIGQLANVRDPDIHGGFPLRGKPMNVYGVKPLEQLENKEIKNLTGILGLIPGEPTEPSELNYGTVALMADADHDGNSIMGLLINFFSQWPELFEAGKIKICRSPVCKWEKGKVKRVFYTMHEYLAAQNADELKGGTLTYLKGLGSLSEAEYSEMLNSPVMETVSLDASWKDELDLVFGPSADRRKDWLAE